MLYRYNVEIQKHIYNCTKVKYDGGQSYILYLLLFKSTKVKATIFELGQ